MSLKAVHVLFVIAAVLLCFGVGTLTFLSYRRDGGVLLLLASVAWWLAGLALVAYGRRVVRKLRGISYL